MRRFAGRVALVLLALAGAGACASAPPPAPPAPVAEERDALGALNAEFRRAYAESRDRMLAAADPVLVVGNDTAVLIRAGGTREEADVTVPVSLLYAQQAGNRRERPRRVRHRGALA